MHNCCAPIRSQLKIATNDNSMIGGMSETVQKENVKKLIIIILKR
jgi:hypothetical protein